MLADDIQVVITALQGLRESGQLSRDACELLEASEVVLEGCKERSLELSRVPLFRGQAMPILELADIRSMTGFYLQGGALTGEQYGSIAAFAMAMATPVERRVAA
jgi:hypothetical protein